MIIIFVIEINLISIFYPLFIQSVISNDIIREEKTVTYNDANIHPKYDSF